MWTEELAPWLRALAALAAFPDSTLSTYMAFNSHVPLQFQGIRCLILASASTRHTCGIQTYMQEKHPIHKND